MKGKGFKNNDNNSVNNTENTKEKNKRCLFFKYM